MSTHSFIGVTRKDPGAPEPQVEYIYCHLDGTPNTVGETLQENYQDPDKIDGLIALGDLTCLGPTLENIRMEPGDDFTPCTTARRRDQHMPWEKCDPMTTRSVREFWNLLETSTVSHQYLHDGDDWQTRGATEGPMNLRDVLSELQPRENTLRVRQEADNPAAPPRRIGGTGD